MGDIIHTLPAVHALRQGHPGARIDWVVADRWRALLEANPDLDEVVALRSDSWQQLVWSVQQLRGRRYTRAIDFQGLYKSAVLAWLSGAPQRIGFARRAAREGGAALFYNLRVEPRPGHVIQMNLALARAAGAKPDGMCFPIPTDVEAEAFVTAQLEARGVRDYFVVSPGGGWRSKCWPAECYGHLHHRLAQHPRGNGWRGVVNFGPHERVLAETVRRVSVEPEPVILHLNLPQLVALLRRARLFVGGDSGPLHLAVALGVPVVGLYGPTDPARNGPFNPSDIVVRNAQADETTYKRGDEPAPSMLSITVDQVAEAVERRLGWMA